MEIVGVDDTTLEDHLKRSSLPRSPRFIYSQSVLGCNILCVFYFPLLRDVCFGNFKIRAGSPDVPEGCMSAKDRVLADLWSPTLGGWSPSWALGKSWNFPACVIFNVPFPVPPRRLISTSLTFLFSVPHTGFAFSLCLPFFYSASTPSPPWCFSVKRASFGFICEQFISLVCQTVLHCDNETI